MAYIPPKDYLPAPYYINIKANPNTTPISISLESLGTPSQESLLLMLILATVPFWM